MAEIRNNPQASEQVHVFDSGEQVLHKVFEVLVSIHPSKGVFLDIDGSCAAIRERICGLDFSYCALGADDENMERLKATGCEAAVCNLDNEAAVIASLTAVLNGRALAAIALVDSIATRPKPDALLHALHLLAAQYNAPLLLSVSNIAHKDVAYKLLAADFNYCESGLLSHNHLRFYTENSLQTRMAQHGFFEIARADVVKEESDQHFPKQNVLLAQGSLIHRYLDWVKSATDPYASVISFVRAYLPGSIGVCKPQTSAEKAPFLSVITRTQGKRPEALRETLLCLTAQTNSDFEVLVLGHMLNGEQQQLVARIIDDTPLWIRRKIRFVTVDHGSRATPLNIGFQKARGDYITILDDDDLVFDDWVESFYRLAQEQPGTILHAYSVFQDWSMFETPYGTQALSASGTPNTLYCTDFDPIRQLCYNTCPTGGIAFPAYVHQKMSLQFNEQLNTTEDWDYLMRASFVCGVSNTKRVTFLYRIWLNGENSKSLHDGEEWQKNQAIIEEGFNRLPLLLPPGSAARIINMMQQLNQSSTGKGLNLDHASVLYVGNLDGFSEENTMSSFMSTTGTKFVCKYEGVDKFDNVTKLRWDPLENGGFVIENFVAELVLSDGSAQQITTAMVSCNGFLSGQQIVFLKTDPQIHIPLPDCQGKEIKEVVITGNLSHKLFDSSMDAVLTGAIHAAAVLPAEKRSTLKRIYKKIRRNLH